MAEEETTETTEETEGSTTEEKPQGETEEATTEETTEEEPEGKGEKDADYYRKQLRRVERQAATGSKKDKAEIAKLKADLQKRLDADKSEQEKAVEAAKEEGATAARAEAQKERRADRLALAVERLAAKGIKTGEGDDAQDVKFRGKPALVLLERAIESGDLDTSDLYDDKDKIRDEGLRAAVGQVLEDEDWLIVRPELNERKTTDSDAGKGGSGAKSLEEMTPDDHLKAIQGK